MKTLLVIGFATILGGCATMSARAKADGLPSGQWGGFLLRNGLRSPVAVVLSEASSEWSGRFSAGDNSVPLERIRVTATRVHFELPGEGAFDGSIAGDSMAGSISGETTGSFSLKREDPASEFWSPQFFPGVP